MVDVLLAHSYFLLLDPKQHAKMRPYPPLNTLHAAAVLRNRGLEVAVFDAMLADDENDFRKALAEHQPKIVVSVRGQLQLPLQDVPAPNA